MKLEGFIGPAYQLDSVNVDCQRCVNLYPEVVESGQGKEKSPFYLRGTPGLDLVAEVGNGPIRLIHTDSIGRIFVVSGNQIFSLSKKEDWRYLFSATVPAAAPFANTAVNTTTNEITATGHGFYTGLKVRYTGTGSFPTPLDQNIDYFVIRVDANTIKLATSFENALAGTTIDITTQGTLTHTLTPQAYGQLKNVKHSDINFTTGTFAKASHGYPTGLAVTFLATGEIASPLAENTTYFVTNRSNDSFQLATSLANALAGTAIDLVDVADSWNKKLLGESGQYGGDPVVLAASSGVVKAASMSFGGDGTDSSTMFVDGANNYLLKDDAGIQTLGVLGAIDVAQAVFNINEDITVQATENIDDLISKATLTIDDNGLRPSLPANSILINFYKETEDATELTDYVIDIFTQTSGSQLTTAELVTYLNSGNPGSKTIAFNDLSFYSAVPVGYTRTTLPVGTFAFDGGDIQTTSSAFNTEIEMPFTRVTLSGEGFGSVPAATQIVWSDGYFILNEFGTNRFWVSGLQDFNVNALSFASSEGSPDILLSLIISNRYLYAFNEKTTEVYANTGNADFPFERVQGGLVEVGIAAEHSVGKIGDIVCWLGRTNEGEGIVYAIDGMTPQRISTHAIEQAISTYADIATAKAYTYQQNGHTFYALNFAEATWVFDFSTRLWHERAYTNDGDLERHRAEFYARDIKRGIHLVADYETNEVFQLRDDIYTDNGDAITRMRVSPHGSVELNQIFYSRFQLDMETGIGLDGDVQGSDPQVMLDYSDNKGRTWSSENWALADAGSGEIGDFNKRVIWRRLGRSRDRVWRVKITDPVKVVLLGAYIDAQVGAS